MIKGDFEDDECYYIDQIEILKDFRNKGYGKKNLYQLKEQLSVSNFKGVSVPTATAFWSNMGAEFYEFCKVCPFNDVAACEGKENCSEFNERYFTLNLN